jgi:hypothetical protein
VQAYLAHLRETGFTGAPLTKITAADPGIGEHLRQAVRTGARCSYWPG